jgi:hypothetical protein
MTLSWRTHQLVELCQKYNRTSIRIRIAKSSKIRKLEEHKDVASRFTFLLLQLIRIFDMNAIRWTCQIIPSETELNSLFKVE